MYWPAMFNEFLLWLILCKTASKQLHYFFIPTCVTCALLGNEVAKDICMKVVFSMCERTSYKISAGSNVITGFLCLPFLHFLL